MTSILVSELVVLALVGAATGLLAKTLPIRSILSHILGAIGKGMRIMLRSSASDHWKEKALLACAIRCLKGIAMLLACIALICGVASCAIFLLYPVLPDLINRLFQFEGLLFTALGAMLCFVTPRGLQSAE